jgi:hypothetical protein
MSEPSALRLLGEWIGQRRVEYLRIHDATFKRTLRPIPFAERQRELERIAAAGTRTGSYRSFREDVRQYEVVAGGYAKLGDRLSVLHRSLPP